MQQFEMKFKMSGVCTSKCGEAREAGAGAAAHFVMIYQSLRLAFSFSLHRQRL